MLRLLLNVRFNAPASRLMSIALPPCVAAMFQMLPSTVNARVPVVPAIRLTSSPSSPAPWMTLSAIVSVADPVSAPSVVTSIALPVLPPASGSRGSSAAIASVSDSALPVAWLRSGRHGPPLQSVAAGGGTTTVGDPLPVQVDRDRQPHELADQVLPGLELEAADLARAGAVAEVDEDVVVGIVQVAGAVRAVERGR